MKMPEGLKRLKCLADFNDPEWKSELVRNTASLMKEMADALETLCEEEPRRIDYETAEEVLKKFKEWK